MKLLYKSLLLLLLITKTENNVFANISSKKASEDKTLCLRHSYVKNIPLNIRNGPGKEYSIISTIKNKYTILLAKYKIDDWCFIKLTTNGQYGWVLCAGISFVNNITAIKDNNITLYRIPNRDEKIAILKTNTTVNVITCSHNWCRITIRDTNLTGWVKKEALWLNNCS